MDTADRKVLIKLDNVRKNYRLGEIGYGTLREDLQSWWALKHGREDPNSRIGRGQHLSGDRLYALRGVDLTVYEGERLGIIGGNGAGKSTLLKLISRVTAPSSGTIDLYGRVTSMLEVGTGFNGDMTGRENIYLNGAILGMSKRQIDERLEEIIDFSEVRDFIDTPVKRYSSGMFVKLGFSVAAHLQSEIVIMDEVLAVGDISFQQKRIARMRQAAEEEKRTILYVSHNMSTVRSLCDRCIVLDQGQIIYDGDVDRAIRYYSDYLLKTGAAGQDLDARERRSRDLTDLCRIIQVDITDDRVRMDGELAFRLTLRCVEAREGVRIRLVVSNVLGAIVGMAYSDGCALAPGRNTLTVRAATDRLSPGDYYANMAIFESHNDTQVRHDFLRNVLSFHVEESEQYFGKSWRPQDWGNMRLAPVRIVEVEQNE